MAIFTWNDSYSVGINGFDDQHNVLVSLINQLYAAMKAGKGSQELAEILNSLASYTQVHFKSEEQALSRFGYPEFPHHLKEHQALIAQVEDFQRKSSQNQIGMSIPVAKFLKEWLSKHILGEDKKYAEFL